MQVLTEVNGKKVLKEYFLDSYEEGVFIVSRKATDFDKIQLKTFDNYLLELKRKYPEGAKIISRKYPEKLPYGQKTLSGQLTIEVPLINQNSKRLSEFQKLADMRKIKLVFESE